MSRGSNEVLVNVLQDPAHVQGFGLREWDLLVRQARRADMLATVSNLINDAGFDQKIPADVRRHFDAHATLVYANQTAISWDVAQIYHVLEGVCEPPILLKGAAYVQASLPVAAGEFLMISISWYPR